jgi:hypothetical protein
MRVNCQGVAGGRRLPGAQGLRRRRTPQGVSTDRHERAGGQRRVLLWAPCKHISPIRSLWSGEYGYTSVAVRRKTWI